jgi:hypothetical protein
MKLLGDELQRRKDMTPDNFDGSDADSKGSTEEVVQAQQRKI